MSCPERALTGLLKLTGFSQLEVSLHLGVSRSRLAGWLAGYSPIPDDMLIKIHRLVSARLGGIGGNEIGRQPVASPVDDSEGQGL